MKTGPLPVDVGDAVLVAVPPERVKLAHVRRVALLEWMTMERLPKKAAMPDWVEAKSSR